MLYRRLGRSGLTVSAYCLGTMTFGESGPKSMMHNVGCDAATSFRIMDKALDAGVNFFDTADVYGDDGMSERIIGDWFAATGKRDRVVLATKFRFRMGEGPNTTGASRVRIMRAVDASLQRLRTDRIDLYQIHMQDLDTPEDETLRALDDLVRAGKVLYIGCSNYAAYRLSDALWTSEVRGLERYVSLQAQYSLLSRGLERELVPLCREKGLGIMPWSPLAGGFLTGKHTREQRDPTSRLAKWNQWWSKYDTDRGWNTLAAVRAIATELSATPGQVALAWCAQQACVSSVIFGARSVEQLDDNLGAAALTLTADQLARLDTASAWELDYPYDFLKQISGRW
jgi:aryl-alcohol dehydrogenase-like predicted oxidoreductase